MLHRLVDRLGMALNISIDHIVFDRPIVNSTELAVHRSTKLDPRPGSFSRDDKHPTYRIVSFEETGDRLQFTAVYRTRLGYLTGYVTGPVSFSFCKFEG